MRHSTERTRVHTGSHWGVYNAEVAAGRPVAVKSLEHDPHPTPLIEAMPSAVYHDSRILQPMRRQG
jgi:trimethylamine-N-oxide reductase (cytochrome c)